MNEQIKLENNIPSFLKEMLEKQYDTKDIEKIVKGYYKKRPVTFRVNTIKASVEKIKEELEKNDIQFDMVDFCEEAFIIKNVTEKEVEQLDIYKNGEIYLQSLSSMLPPIILKPEENIDILDMAAAPGGKTTQIAAITNNKSRITACEINNIRAERLKYNIDKQGATSVYLMKKDSRFIDDFFSFDKILLDAPCSGSGTLDLNNQNSDKIFTKKLVDKSVKSQLSLLKKAVKVLKKGHEMVYSTCSILKCENEDIVNEVLKQNNVEIIPIDYEWISKLPVLPTKINGTLCIAPNEYFEGFFIAKLRKK